MSAQDGSTATESPVLRLLHRLEGVRTRGAGRWTAKCPAHADKSPSLSITATDDERVLLKCWTGCSAREVVEAVGLTLSDLFPERLPPEHVRRVERRAFSAEQRNAIIAHDALIVVLVAERIARNGDVSADDLARLRQASERIARASA